MRKITYLLLIFLTLPLAWSCNKDDDDKTNLAIPEGWTENGDLGVISKAPWFLFRSADGDSIKLSFHKIDGVGSVYCNSYEKNKNGKNYSLNYYSSMKRVSSIEKDGKKELYGLSKGETCRIGYEMKDNNTVIIHELPRRPLSEPSEFRAVKEYDSNTKLIGGWYSSQVVDSTIFVFEPKMAKEYLFARGGSTVLYYQEYPDYYSSIYSYYIDDELLEINGYLRFDSLLPDCKIDDDNLTIYWESPGKTTTYKRIKN